MHLFIYVFIYLFLGPQPWHMEVPRPVVQLELQLLAYFTATAMLDSKPHLQPTPQLTATQDPNTLSRTRDQIRILMDTTQVCYH